MSINKPLALQTAGDATDATSYFATSVVSKANSILLVYVTAGAVTVGETNSPTVTGLGLTWVPIDNYENVTNNVRGSWYYAIVGSSPPTGQITFTFPFLQSNCQWHIISVTHVDLVSPIVQTKIARSSVADFPSITMDSPLGAGNALFAGMVVNSQAPILPTPDGVLLSISSGFTAPTIHSSVGYKVDGNNTYTWDTTTNPEKAYVAFELKADNSARYILLENGNRLFLETGASFISDDA